MVRTMQIIVGALAMGVISFGVVALVMTAEKAQPAVPGEEMLFYGSVGMTCFILIGRLIVPSKLVAAQRRLLIAGTWTPVTTRQGQPVNAGLPENATDADRLYTMLTTRTIMRGAFAEGAAFLNLTIFLTGHNWWNFGIAGLMLAMLLADFPTAGRAEDWVNEQLMLIEAEKSFPDNTNT